MEDACNLKEVTNLLLWRVRLTDIVNPRALLTVRAQ